MSVHDQISAEPAHFFGGGCERRAYRSVYFFTRLVSIGSDMTSSLVETLDTAKRAIARPKGIYFDSVDQSQGIQSDEGNGSSSTLSGLENTLADSKNSKLKSESLSEPFTVKHWRLCDEYLEAQYACKQTGSAPAGVETLIVELLEGDPAIIFDEVQVTGHVFAGSSYGRGMAYAGTPVEIGTILSVIKERLTCADSFARIGHGCLRTEEKVMTGGKSQLGSWTKMMTTFTAIPRTDDYSCFPDKKRTKEKSTGLVVLF